MGINVVNSVVRVVASSPVASIIAGAMAYLMPMGEVFLVMMAFVAVDLAVGLLASRKCRIPVNSRRLRLSVVKMASYTVAIMLAYAAERALGIEWLGSFKFIVGFICLVEFISILENLAILTEKPIFLRIIKLIRGKAKEKHGSLTDDILAEKNGEEHIKNLVTKKKNENELQDKKD